MQNTTSRNIKPPNFIKRVAQGWRLCPSVTSGGKSHFLFKRTATTLLWIIWNRQAEQWQARCERFAQPAR
jgi:hypothetical protein